MICILVLHWPCVPSVTPALSVCPSPLWEHNHKAPHSHRYFLLLTYLATAGTLCFFYGREQAISLWAHCSWDGVCGIGYVHDFRRGTTGVRHILCYGSDNGGHGDGLVGVSVLPQGKESWLFPMFGNIWILCFMFLAFTLIIRCI